MADFGIVLEKNSIVLNVRTGALCFYEERFSLLTFKVVYEITCQDN
jgi:hypothetical protein